MIQPEPIRKTRLRCGLRLVTERLPGLRSAAVGYWVGTGSRDEPEPLAGASHFLEHLLFKGTQRRTAVEIAWDTLLWHRTHDERLLGDAWDWSHSESIDEGLVALGEFSDKGLGVIAYSRAVRFGTLGVCPQR